MPDQQSDSEESEEERQEAPTAPDVPGTDEPGSRPRGSRTDEDEVPGTTPEPHEPTD